MTSVQPPTPDASPDASFQLKEYEALKKEIEGAVQETRVLERYALVVTGGTWAWLLATDHRAAPEPVWWLPVPFVVFAGLRCVALYLSVRRIGDYLRDKVEPQFFPLKSGWESHSRPPGPEQEPIYGILRSTAMLFWMALLVTAALGPVFADRSEGGRDPNVKATTVDTLSRSPK
jgi:hypothetical protein